MFKFFNSLAAFKPKIERRDHNGERVDLLSDASSNKSSGASQPASGHYTIREATIPAHAFPPSYQDATTPRWKVDLLFSTGEEFRGKDPVISPNEGWYGRVTINTPNIVGLMQEGLYLSQSNVQVQETHLKPFYCHLYKKWHWDLHFTLVDPKWSGYMIVRSLDAKATVNFRMEHVWVDRVYRASVVDTSKGHNFVYYFNKISPSYNANYVLNDQLMEGLWPWPRKDLVCEKEAPGTYF
ncbi:hypothetical protein FHETE_1356 [Fusarium heterosporum]|uniref:Uncharacterized protein n=1 Tax=Fusarium heterosporum TaxID=42747 RepID=A0A8H5U1Z5_FUSHE|nr:hypothetical protein FHETE_1356 [Fusarium heterosporum]